MDTLATFLAGCIIILSALLVPVGICWKLEERRARNAERRERHEERAERRAERAGVCPICGASTRVGARYCPRCGLDLRRRVCPYCGHRPHADARFCGRCGRELDAAPRPVRLSDDSYLMPDGTIYGEIPF